ncbi:hypothetical protein ACJMK2_008908 [Sinanodonta woodiana]|uniref:C2H2-type domain-containing protein n=1 Tax=Sinanodonta woodiana TaxID=1069815 RepID=A0ABD3VAU7_SINWO
MSDGAEKADGGDTAVEDSAISGSGRGRLRTCKQCRFQTADVREFSQHRLLAHAEDNTNEEKVNRKNSLRFRRKSSVAHIPDVNGLVCSKQKSSSDILETLRQDTSGLETVRTDHPEQSSETKVETNSTGDLDNQNKDSSSNKKEDISATDGEQSLNTATELNPVKNRISLEEDMESVMGNYEELEHEQDEEPRLVIAESDHDGIDLESSDIAPILTRTGNIQNRTYICNVCEFSTTSAKVFLHHQKDFHGQDILIYECDICEYATKYKQKLPRHRKLHFTGKDGNGTMSGSDLESSFTEKDLRELKETGETNSVPQQPVKDQDEEEDEGDEEVEEEAVTGDNTEKSSCEIVEKKKRVRQEVDPDKYFEVFDDVGIKYACSKCGNVYKWRKSLNKHWKEKHFGDVPDPTKPPPTLQNYTIVSQVRSKYGSHSSSLYNSSQSSIPQTMPTVESKSVEEMTTSVVMPKFIGPFIAGTNCAPSVPASSTTMPHGQSDLRQQLVRSSPARSHLERPLNFDRSNLYSLQKDMSDSQTEPLDFSVKKEIKAEPAWDEAEENSSGSYQNSPVPSNRFSKAIPQTNETITPRKSQDTELDSILDAESTKNSSNSSQSPVLQCSKCAFVAKTLVDYSSHMTLHLNKRAFKCAECQEHFSGIEDLNTHFALNHAEKIQEHKEAIQKIPHGLQQTYHLLKMPLEAISSLSSQELLSNEPKQLKCSMCNFVAKWPAELQKHAVSHSEERPFVCMVCGSTYKWKWDLVKHFEKSHHSLPNPYKRRDPGMSTQPVKHSFEKSPHVTPVPISMSSTTSALIDSDNFQTRSYMQSEDEPLLKKRRLSDTDLHLVDGNNFGSEKNYRDGSNQSGFEDSNENHQMPRRPSSEPSKTIDDDFTSGDDGYFVDGEMNGRGSPAFSQGSRDENRDNYGHDHDRNENQQKDILNALKQRLSSSSSKSTISDNVLDRKSLPSDLLPYKCSHCEYRARWPSEITQHMKNHSNEKPYHCPRCSYRSKWKWDVVKHLRRCGGGTVHDVIDTTKIKKMAPPNVTVLPHGDLQQQTPQPQHSYYMNSILLQKSPGATFTFAENGKNSSGLDRERHAESTYANSDTPMAPPAHSNSASNLNQKQPVFKSLINDGVYHCLECPFMGNSPAELRRHAVLHSENKPFMCSTCGYSSRWKCDLKKHMKTYGHYSSSDLEDETGLTAQDKLDMEKTSDNDEDQRTMYICGNCSYSTSRKHEYDTHQKMHDDQKKEDTTPAKFKCKQCDYQGNDLSSFLQHKVSHSATAQSTNQGQDIDNSSDVSNRTIHLKHRRKPLKQMKCFKCPFTTMERSSLNIHECLHEQRGSEAFMCTYCDYSVFSRSLLLQHMRLHPEHNPGECCDLGTLAENDVRDLEEMEQKELHSDEHEREESMDGEDSVLDLPEGALDFSRTSTPQSSVTAISSIPTNSIARNRQNTDSPSISLSSSLPCEWCGSTFQNVSTLYQHARILHPLELKAQEDTDNMPGEVTHQKQVESTDQSKSASLKKNATLAQQYFGHNHPTLPLPMMPNSSTLKSHTRPFQNPISVYMNSLKNHDGDPFPKELAGMMHNSSSQLLIKAKKTITSPPKRGRSFQCTKCSFTAPNAVTYLRHIERHGSNCKHTCRYCDYSIDRLNLLYQHMRGTHGNLWKGTPEEKINLSSGGEDSNNNFLFQVQSSPSESHNASDNSDDLNGSFSSCMDYNESEMDPGALSRAIQANKGGRKPVLVIREETTWRGIPVLVCSLDGKKHYKCPKCYYISSNAANTTNHVRQHGSRRKYTCHQCDYSVDNLKLIEHHVESVHPKEPLFIQMSQDTTYSMVSSNHADMQSEEMNKDTFSNIQLQMPLPAPQPLKIFGSESRLKRFEQSFLMSTNKRSKDIMTSSSENIGTLFCCPKCPFKVRKREVLHRHLERHGADGEHKCNICDYSVDNPDILMKHTQIHKRSKSKNYSLLISPKFREEDTEPQDDMDAMTESTGEIISDKNQLKNIFNRMKASSGRVRYKCSRCPYNTFCKNNIIKHKKQHIVKSRYRCIKCNYSASRAYLLQQHMKFHECHHPSVENKASNYQDVVLDPFSDVNLKTLQNMHGPDGGDEEQKSDSQDLNSDKTSDNPDVTSLDGYEEAMEEEEQEEEEQDIETSLMEEELKENGQVEDLDDSAAKEGTSFDHELQFRNYKCQKCPYSSNSASEFRKHVRLHGSNLKFRCDYCSYSLDRLNLLAQHRKLHFQEPNFDPSPMMVNLVNKNHPDAAAITERVSQESNLQVMTEMSGESSFKLNSKLFQNGPTSEEKIRYTCTKCPYRCNALKSFKCHIQMHGLKRKYKCDYCNWSADRLNLLYQHRKVHNNESGYDPNPGDIVFLNREFALDTKDFMEQQNVGVVGMALNQHPESPFSSSQELFKYQQFQNSSQKIFQCKICKFITSNENTYTYHKNLHRMQASYSCSECSFSTNNTDVLRDHMKLHKKEKPRQGSQDQKQKLQCYKCPYNSPSKSLLEMHLSLHNSGKRYTCEFCDYSVDRYNLLEQHMRMHLKPSDDEDSTQDEMDMKDYEVRPGIVTPKLYFTAPYNDHSDDSNNGPDMEHKCEKCPYSTPSKDELKDHEKKHNVPSKTTCPCCTFSCSEEETLLAHVQIHFPSAPVSKEMLNQLKDQQKGGHSRRNLSKELEKSGSDLLGSISRSAANDRDVQNGEPDSTVVENLHKDNQEEVEEKTKASKEGVDVSDHPTEGPSVKTKVYVCQYCEREFENKVQMLQHEKQHLIGHQY